MVRQHAGPGRNRAREVIAPDLAGAWALHGITLGPDGGVLYEWDADLAIDQSADGIAVAIETSGFWNSRKLQRNAIGACFNWLNVPIGAMNAHWNWQNVPISGTAKFS